jgi:glycosyltransferase involved in cell wall biosynthesis
VTRAIRVIFDARPLQPANRHWGPATVIQKISDYLPPDIELLGLSHSFERPPGISIRQWPQLPLTSQFFFNCLPVLLGGDVYWGTNHMLPRVPLGYPSVVTIHDLLSFRDADSGHEKVPRPYFLAALRRSRLIVTISNTVREELTQLFPNVAPKCVVIRNGVDLSEFTSARDRGRLNLSRPVRFLIAGAHRPRKNLQLPLAALRLLKESGIALEVVVTGDVCSAFRPLVDAHKDFVLTTGPLPRDQLVKVFCSSDILLYTSVYEGFGLPVLEGLSAGCFVATLDTPVSREVGGAAVLRFPNDPGAWFQGLRDFIFTPTRQDQLRAAALHYQAITWRNCAMEYANLFRQLSSRT